ncbi:MAG: transporter substrate-binding domain-containing protein [Acidiferrobacterales bacterium]
MRRLSFHIVLALVAIAFSVLVTAAGNPALAQEQSKLYEVLKRGKVVVGVTSEVPPFGSIDETGKPVGFDIDIARLIAKALFEDPEKVEFKKIAFSARWSAVGTGEIDFGIMVTTIWPDRLARVNFTRGYIRSGLSVLARDDVPVDDWRQLDNADYTMAILDTPSEHKLMGARLPNMKALILGSEADMLTAVRTGRAQALLIDAPVAAWRAAKLPNLKDLGMVGSGTQNAIFMRQNDFQWWYYLDAMVAEMRCGSLYGEYKVIYNKWFKVDPPSQDTCLAFQAGG